jgi:hypothetical protein
MESAGELDGGKVSNRTEVDSHANVPVVGRNVAVISASGKTVDVCPFSPDYEPVALSVVDVAVQYENSYDGKSYIFLITNALHVPSMEDNLIPPFVMREAGIRVNDTPKLQVEDPSESDDAITFQRNRAKDTTVSVWSIFLFTTSKPSDEVLAHSTDVYLLTPTRWNPH